MLAHNRYKSLDTPDSGSPLTRMRRQQLVAQKSFDSNDSKRVAMIPKWSKSVSLESNVVTVNENAKLEDFRASLRNLKNFSPDTNSKSYINLSNFVVAITGYKMIKITLLF